LVTNNCPCLNKDIAADIAILANDSACHYMGEPPNPGPVSDLITFTDTVGVNKDL
jgi:hypothetical protein